MVHISMHTAIRIVSFLSRRKQNYCAYNAYVCSVLYISGCIHVVYISFIVRTTLGNKHYFLGKWKFIQIECFAWTEIHVS